MAITPGWRTSKTKRHVVKHIIAPAQVPIDERPPVPTQEERWAAALAARAAKDERRAAIQAEKRALAQLQKKNKKGLRGDEAVVEEAAVQAVSAGEAQAEQEKIIPGAPAAPDAAEEANEKPARSGWFR